LLIDISYTKEFAEKFEKLKQHTNANDLLDLDGIGKQVDFAHFSRQFFSKKGVTTADVSIDSNSNVDDMSIISYEVESGKPVHKLNSYFLLYKYGKKLFGEDIAFKMIEAHFTKEIYINDFYKFNAPYCFNFSCIDVVFNGLPFVKKIKSEPPKNFISVNGQIQQFVNYASNSIAGAVGLADLLIVYSYYVDKLMSEHPEVPEDFKWYLIKQEIQSTVFTVNQPFRNGVQSPFTNVSVYDSIFLEKVCSEYYFPDGSQPNVKTVQKLQELYIDLMNDTLRKTPVTFPVTTACFAVDENRNIIDKEYLRFISEKNLEFGFINFYAGETSTLSSCCRLRSDTKKEYFNQFGAGGTKIGSLGVVTLNLPRLAIKAQGNVDRFLFAVEEFVELTAKINHVKRLLIQKRIENGNLPLYTYEFMDIKKQYSTCGLTGVNEAVAFLGLDILTPEGQDVVTRLLNCVNRVNDAMEAEFGFPHNCEQVPAENSAIKLAQADKVLGYQDEYEVYSNQFIPLITKADLLDRIKLQGMFDSYMTGGAICHLNVEQKIDKVEDMIALIEYAVKKGVIYSAVNYNIQRCENEHMTVGKLTKCPICNAKITDNFTRVVGFLVNTKNFHKVRREHDYPERQFYKGVSL
jgi:ribonucleoside-triphosphate reductase